MRFALSSVFLVSMIVTVMVFLADFAAWTNDRELAYEIASHDLRRLLADCGDDLICNRPPTTACRHTNQVVEIYTDLGPRRRFPLGTANADASVYFDAGSIGADITVLRSCDS